MTVIVQVSVSAPGAAPPAVGKIGNTLKANTAPVTAVNETASVVLGADSASAHIASNKELITLKPNIKYKEVIKVLNQTGIIRNATCDFTATGSVALTEQILQPLEFQVNTQLCKEDFRSDWEAIEMGVSVFDNLPPTFTDFIIANTAGQVAQQIETNIWSGSSTLPGQFDGFLQLLTASNAVIDLTAAAQVTSSNLFV